MIEPSRRKGRIPALVGTVLAITFWTSFIGSPAAQAANTNPIRWTIYKTLYGKHGEDIPLRYGQHDQDQGTRIADGFGTRHIEDKHELWGNWVSTANKIEDTIQNDPKCDTVGTSVTCSTGGAYVFVAVYSTRVDSHSGDGRPVGVITFYWYCNTCISSGDGVDFVHDLDRRGVDQ